MKQDKLIESRAEGGKVSEKSFPILWHLSKCLKEVKELDMHWRKSTLGITHSKYKGPEIKTNLAYPRESSVAKASELQKIRLEHVSDHIGPDRPL